MNSRQCRSQHPFVRLFNRHRLSSIPSTWIVHAAMLLQLLSCFAAVAVSLADIVDTSRWIGAEYQPSQSSNEDWLYHYEDYRVSVERELALVKRALEFTTLRVFLHSMIFEADSEQLLRNMESFLTSAEKYSFRVGFVFFDDCWNHVGMDLSRPCQPVKGVHNGCWMASPQDIERTSVERFKPYVTHVVSRFLKDERVAWWEVFNEPNDSSFSASLRKSGYEWITELVPLAPILSCWDENDGTDLVDHHQYELPWGGTGNHVFVNTTGKMKGGLVTEAGARWYQGTASDAGSPLTVIDWLMKLRSNPSAPFIPGAMINWEVMVSNSNTRWHWGTDPESPEVLIPWHQHLFADGTPVSYTEAAAIRRYVTGKDDFYFFEDFLNTEPNPLSNEITYTIKANNKYIAVSKESKMLDFLFEATLWFQDTSESYAEVALRRSDDGCYLVRVDASALTVSLMKLDVKTNNTLVLSVFDASLLDCSILRNAWNLVRVLVSGSDFKIFVNPMFSDVYPDTDPIPGGPPVRIQAMPPRIHFVDLHNPILKAGEVSISAGNSDVKVDYISILPPLLFGTDFDPNMIV
jgi:hypothetical protein